jgi:hypothetical protein
MNTARLIALFALVGLSVWATPADPPTSASKELVGEKNNGNFENSLISPWQKGVWCSSGKKPATFEVGLTGDKAIVAGSEWALSIKVSGDASHKRVAPLVYQRIPVNVEQDGAAFTLSCEVRNGENGFSVFQMQLFVMDKNGKYIGGVKLVEEGTIKPTLAKEAWNPTAIAAVIPENLRAQAGYLQVRLNLIADNSSPDVVYESFIDNIKLTQTR